MSIRNTLMMGCIVVLLVTNILSITSSAFHGLMYGMLSIIPYERILSNSHVGKQKKIQAESQKLRKQNTDLLAKSKARQLKLGEARKVSQRIAKRTAKNLAVNVSSIAGEAVPYLGAGLIVAVTVADVKDGCDNIKDMNEMLGMLEEDGIEDHVNEVCGIEVPDVNEVMETIKQDVEGTVNQAREKSMESARELYDALGEQLYKILH